MSKGWRTEDVISDVRAPEDTSALGIQAVQKTIFATHSKTQLSAPIVVEQRAGANIGIGYVTHDRAPTPDYVPIAQVERFRAIVGVAHACVDNSPGHINGRRTPDPPARCAARLAPRPPTPRACRRIEGKHFTRDFRLLAQCRGGANDDQSIDD